MKLISIIRITLSFLLLVFFSSCFSDDDTDPPNKSPGVDAGDEQAITFPTDSVHLMPSVFDDGLPEGSVLTFTWSQEIGSGTASFSNENTLNPIVTFDEPGTYIFKLTVSDGDLEASDIIRIIVQSDDDNSDQLNISSVSGNFLHGDIVSISGSGFGSKPNAAPLKYDNFETGTDGERLLDELSGGWDNDHTLHPVTYNETKTRGNSTMSMFQNFTDGNYRSYVGLTTSTLPPDTRKLYFSGWFNMETTGSPSRNVKILNMSSYNGNFDEDYIWNSRVDIYPSNGSGHLYVDNRISEELFHDWSTNVSKTLMDDGLWHRLEGWVDLDDSDGLGYRDLHMDLEKTGQVTGNNEQGSLAPDDIGIETLLIGYYYSCDTYDPQPSATRYWDELYVDITQARIELGNNSVFTSCTHREIQIPSFWSNQSVQFTLNQGAFEDDESVYLFVIDENGNVSNGYPITLNQSDGASETIIIDNGDEGTTASDDENWINSTYYNGYYGKNYIYSIDGPGHYYKYTTGINGAFEVSACWVAIAGRPTDAFYEIEHQNGTDSIVVNQEQDGSQWNTLGTYNFDGTATVRVYSGSGGAEGLCADAVQFKSTY